MKLLNDMHTAMQEEKSLFAAQLLKEDIARLERLVDVAKNNPDPAVFAKQSMVLGWTANDMRTFELNPELGKFLEIVHRHFHPVDGVPSNASHIDAAWIALHKRRVDLLVGCLSRPRLD